MALEAHSSSPLFQIGVSGVHNTLHRPMFISCNRMCLQSQLHVYIPTASSGVTRFIMSIQILDGPSEAALLAINSDPTGLRQGSINTCIEKTLGLLEQIKIL